MELENPPITLELAPSAEGPWTLVSALHEAPKGPDARGGFEPHIEKWLCGGDHWVVFATTGWIPSNGRDFDRWIKVGPHEDAVTDCPLVSFMGFAFDFRGKTDHHLDFTGIWIEPVKPDHTNNHYYRIRGGYRDKNHDDKYNWKIYFLIRGWHHNRG